MKWHDARVEPPQKDAELLVKGCLECGTYYYRPSSLCFGEKNAYWSHDEYNSQLVSEYPFYTTVGEIEKELGDD